MNKRKIIIILFLFFSIISYSQNNVLRGEVIDVENNKPIPYVNIGVFNKMVGTVSNREGLFNLKLNEEINVNDTITFSAIGYKTKHVPISNLDKDNNVVLIESKIEQLEEVIVLPSQKQELTIIGRDKKGGLSSKFFSPYDENIDDKLSREQGMLFKIKNSYEVQDINFHISLNEFKNVKLRLNFYKVEHGLPKELLNKKDIIIDVEDGQLGWVNFDLKPFNIFLDKSLGEVAITLQWLSSMKKTENSEHFGITAVNSLKKNGLFRSKGMEKWAKWGQTLSFYLNCTTTTQ